MICFSLPSRPALWPAIALGLAAASLHAVSPPVENLAFRRPVAASSARPGAAAELAVDYRYATHWQAGEPGADQWLQVDLGQSRTITGAELRFTDDRVARGYTVAVSPDGTTWSTAVTAPSQATQIRYHPFAATGRYVRWQLTALASGTASLSELWVFGPPAEPLPALPKVTPPAPPYLSTGFVRGADISHLLQNEHYGAAYYDDEVRKDPLEILRDHGINTVRIKIWNDPGRRDASPARLHDPLGFNNPYWAARLAVRARQLGFRIMIDFHYSDTWADPAKQFVPHEWIDQDIPKLAESVYSFTADTLRLLADHGVTPEWVQVGNEISNGMLWPHGRWADAEAGGSWANLAQFLQAGYRATKSVDPAIKVVVHYDHAGRTERSQEYYDQAVRHGVQWDVTGLSYYPHWHGSLEGMTATVRNLAERYGKPVNLVEIAHPWTTENFDTTGNALGVPERFPYPATIEGQSAFLDDVVARLKSVPEGRGEGLIYWEPEWITVPAAGWAIGEDSGWENAALFDQRGRVLASLAHLGNPAPKVTIDGQPMRGPGRTVTATGAFDDPGSRRWTATVDYGDGSGRRELRLQPDRTFVLRHAYPRVGDYVIVVEITDDEGRSSKVSRQIALPADSLLQP